MPPRPILALMSESANPLPDAAAASSKAAEEMIRQLRRPIYLKLYFLRKLPLALAAGLRVEGLDRELCEVSVPYSWRTTNPFRSTYFAAQSMAAELSTGLLASVAARSAPRSVSMLIVDLRASFIKKATDMTVFRCSQGALLSEAVSQALQREEAVTREVATVGCMRNGVEVSRFSFTWSFKPRSG